MTRGGGVHRATEQALTGACRQRCRPARYDGRFLMPRSAVCVAGTSGVPSAAATARWGGEDSEGQRHVHARSGRPVAARDVAGSSIVSVHRHRTQPTSAGFSAGEVPMPGDLLATGLGVNSLAAGPRPDPSWAPDLSGVGRPGTSRRTLGGQVVTCAIGRHLKRPEPDPLMTDLGATWTFDRGSTSRLCGGPRHRTSTNRHASSPDPVVVATRSASGEQVAPRRCRASGQRTQGRFQRWPTCR